jgi:hypothetical protein
MIFVGRTEEKRQLGRPKFRMEDNIKMDHKETVCEGVYRAQFVQNRLQCRALVNTVMNHPNPSSGFELNHSDRQTDTIRIQKTTELSAPSLRISVADVCLRH